jgi:hypothetical protein
MADGVIFISLETKTSDSINQFNRRYIMHPADKIVLIGSALAFMALAFILWTT